MPVPDLQILQYAPPDGTWQDIPGYEGTIVEDYWSNIFSPDVVCWWAIGWKTGDIVYYAWQTQNACSGQVIAPGIVGTQPGPPGPPGPTGTIFQSSYYMDAQPLAADGLATYPSGINQAAPIPTPWPAPITIPDSPAAVAVPLTQLLNIPANTIVQMSGWLLVAYLTVPVGGMPVQQNVWYEGVIIKQDGTTVPPIGQGIGQLLLPMGSTLQQPGNQFWTMTPLATGFFFPVEETCYLGVHLRKQPGITTDPVLQQASLNLTLAAGPPS